MRFTGSGIPFEVSISLGAWGARLREAVHGAAVWQPKALAGDPCRGGRCPAATIATEVDELGLSLRLLLLIGAANSAPILATRLLGTRWSEPLDAGRLVVDGRPLLGASKTLGGLVAAVVGTALAAALLGFSIGLGALFGVLSMLGDALSSFVKRRLGLAVSGRATGIDQIPEALLPLLVLRGLLDLSWFQVAAITLGAWEFQTPSARPSTGSRSGLQRAEVREIGLLDGRGCRVGRSPTVHWP